jgi:hypothetical protein
MPPGLSTRRWSDFIREGSHLLYVHVKNEGRNECGELFGRQGSELASLGMQCEAALHSTVRTRTRCLVASGWLGEAVGGRALSPFQPSARAHLKLHEPGGIFKVGCRFASFD